MEDQNNKMSLGSVANKQHAHQHPHGQASPQGESAVWGGPLSQEGRPHAPGDSRGPNGIQVLKYPVEYQYKPITQCAKSGRDNEPY